MDLLVENLKKDIIPDWMNRCARKEHILPASLIRGIIDGSIIVPRSHHSPVTDEKLCAIGTGLSTKVNANIGTSADRADVGFELEKLHAAMDAGADAVMDLSTGGDLAGIRRAIRQACTVPLGTVPIYQVACELFRSGKSIGDLSADHLFDVIEQHAAEGVDFVTVHCGITKVSLKELHAAHRLAGVVSRGGALLVKLMTERGIENPLYEQFDRLLEIARTYDLCLSLGDGFRPGALADASDRAQFAELRILGELNGRARSAGVQVMIEGPGHIPLHQIAANVEKEKSICSNAPFYVLGPLVTDVAAGYDHITSAIGGAVAAAHGADFLCYVTPSEHIHLPEIEDVRMGVMASRIAAHAGDIAKNIPGARQWDDEMSRARKALDWEKQQELAMDGKKFSALRKAHMPSDTDVCTMCGPLCAMRDTEKVGDRT